MKGAVITGCLKRDGQVVRRFHHASDNAKLVGSKAVKRIEENILPDKKIVLLEQLREACNVLLGIVIIGGQQCSVGSRDERQIGQLVGESSLTELLRRALENCRRDTAAAQLVELC